MTGKDGKDRANSDRAAETTALAEGTSLRTNVLQGAGLAAAWAESSRGQTQQAAPSIHCERLALLRRSFGSHASLFTGSPDPSMFRFK